MNPADLLTAVANNILSSLGGLIADMYTVLIAVIGLALTVFGLNLFVESIDRARYESDYGITGKDALKVGKEYEDYEYKRRKREFSVKITMKGVILSGGLVDMIFDSYFFWFMALAWSWSAGSPVWW